MMPKSKALIVSTIVGTAILFCFAFAMNSLTVSSAKATPQLAKGKPCNTCHEGSPPSKSNVKK
jgi:hypothetical protein